jgi:hypothetical protein
MISCVDVDAYSVERSLDGLFGPTVKHLWFDAGIVGIPGDQHQLGGRTSVSSFEFQVDQSVTWLVLRQLRAKIFVCLRPLSLLFNHNGFLIFNLVNVVSKLLSLSQLEILEGRVDLV